MKSMDDFYKANPITKSLEREKTISEILGESQENILIFERGFIDKIDDNGNYLGNAGKEVIEYVEKFIEMYNLISSYHG